MARGKTFIEVFVAVSPETAEQLRQAAFGARLSVSRYARRILEAALAAEPIRISEERDKGKEI